MSHYLIFIPGDDRADPSKLDAVGLSHLKANAFFHPIQQGPSGLRGVNVAWNSLDQKHFDADKQTWIEAVPNGDLKAGRYWVGFWKDDPPTPTDLAWQGTRFEGSMITLGDGNQWLIPAAGLLPSTWKLNRDGEPELQVKELFTKFFERSKQWFVQFIEHDASDVSIRLNADVWEYLYEALSFNYRMTPEVVSELGLWNTSNIVEGLLKTVDGLHIRDEMGSQKKRVEQSAV